MKELFDDFVVFCRHDLCLVVLWAKFPSCLQNYGSHLSSLRNYRSHFSDTCGIMGQNFEPKWYVPVQN